MSQTLIDRVKEKMNKEYLTVKEIAAQAGVSDANLYKWLKETVKPKSVDAKKLKDWVDGVVIPNSSNVNDDEETPEEIELKALIKYIKRKKGWTQGQVSENAGYESQTLAQVLSRGGEGVLPAIDQLKRVYKEVLEDYQPETPPYNRFKIKMNPRFEPIPYHDIDVAADSSNSKELANDKNGDIQDYYYIPEFSGCRAFNCYNDSMEPLIKKGSKIFARKIENWQDYLEYGQVYAIGLNDGRRVLKYIKKGLQPDTFLLVSENKHYDDREIHHSLIRSIWLIDGSMDKMTQSTFFILKYPNNNAVAEPVMTFGKHKGKKYSDVPLDYWRWLYKKHDAGEAVSKEILDYIEASVPEIKHSKNKPK